MAEACALKQCEREGAETTQFAILNDRNILKKYSDAAAPRVAGAFGRLEDEGHPREDFAVTIKQFRAIFAVCETTVRGPRRSGSDRMRDLSKMIAHANLTVSN